MGRRRTFVVTWNETLTYSDRITTTDPVAAREEFWQRYHNGEYDHRFGRQTLAETSEPQDVNVDEPSR